MCDYDKNWCILFFESKKDIFDYKVKANMKVAGAASLKSTTKVNYKL